jgi:hypothetical protein
MPPTRMTWHGDEWMRQARQAAARGLLLGMEHVLAESRQVVPLDESTLERSGTASVDEGTLTGAVSYDTVYAARQHEELTWRHLPGRTAKYLEIPFNAEAPTVLGLIRAQIRRTTR